MWIPGAPRLASLVPMASSKSGEGSLSKVTVKGDREKHPMLLEVHACVCVRVRACVQ